MKCPGSCGWLSVARLTCGFRPFKLRSAGSSRLDFALSLLAPSSGNCEATVFWAGAKPLAEASAKSLAQDIFADLSDKFVELRRQIHEDTQQLVGPMYLEAFRGSHAAVSVLEGTPFWLVLMG